VGRYQLVAADVDHSGAQTVFKIDTVTASGGNVGLVLCARGRTEQQRFTARLQDCLWRAQTMSDDFELSDDQRGKLLRFIVRFDKIFGDADLDFVQDEQGVAGWGRAAIHRIGKLRRFGHVVTQKSLVPSAMMRCFHPRTVTPKDAIVLRHLIWRGSEN
jgi:hypothetical protein